MNTLLNYNKTIEDRGIDYLITKGMSMNQAKAVMTMVVQAKENDVMKDRWDEPAYAYPSSILNLMFISCNRYALQYINDNIPQAWFKPMFM